MVQSEGSWAHIFADIRNTSRDQISRGWVTWRTRNWRCSPKWARRLLGRCWRRNSLFSDIAGKMRESNLAAATSNDQYPVGNNSRSPSERHLKSAITYTKPLGNRKILKS